jgi:hypothetical protein
MVEPAYASSVSFFLAGALLVRSSSIQRERPVSKEKSS